MTLKRSECSVPLYVFHQEHLSAVDGSYQHIQQYKKNPDTSPRNRSNIRQQKDHLDKPRRGIDL